MERKLISQIKTDCRYFKGSSPCIANKKYGATCGNCNMYEKVDSNILIIKLGAAGDVIRTTPLLHALRKRYPFAKIHWLTDYPMFVPLKTEPSADEVYEFNLRNVTYLNSFEFDLVINLDKDREAIALTTQIRSIRKAGFIMRNGHCYPADENAVHKFLTGVDDVFSKENSKSYMEEIFEICGFEYCGERYVIDIRERGLPDLNLNADKKIIGLNTGSGERWQSRNWSERNWEQVIYELIANDFEVILLGGEAEDARNRALSGNTGAKYFGVHELGRFVELVDRCDVIVSQVTMCMHIALALGKKLVLMNNIFNRNEFELFGNGVIVEPERECKCYFGQKCSNDSYNCMDHIAPETIVKESISVLETIEA